MIEFANVTVKEGAKILLSAISFQIKDKEKVLFCGRSGSGKSTLLKTILGGYIPAEGALFLNGQKITAHNVGDLRRTIAYIFQEPVLFGETVWDFLQIPFSFKFNEHLSFDRKKVVFLLERLHLKESLLSSSIAVLSGGEKQRLAVAAALLLGKTVFVLDEITSALDMESKQVVKEIFSQDIYTVIAATHDEHFFKVPASVMELDQGKLLMQGE